MERQEPVDQHSHPALALLAARPDIFARQGSVVATWRRRGTRTYGPYFRLAYRDSGRQTSIYLGREDKPNNLVQEVRQKLALLQGPFRHCRALDRLRRHISAALRVQKAKLDAQLRPFGLRLKGFEVRGCAPAPYVVASPPSSDQSAAAHGPANSDSIPRAAVLRAAERRNARSPPRPRHDWKRSWPLAASKKPLRNNPTDLRQNDSDGFSNKTGNASVGNALRGVPGSDGTEPVPYSARHGATGFVFKTHQENASTHF